MHDPNIAPRPSDGRFQHSADSTTFDWQRQATRFQAESSSQSLTGLTTMCQDWRSFTTFEHASPAPLMDAECDQQMWPGKDDSRVTTQIGGNGASALQQCIDGETAEQQGSILSCDPYSEQLESAAADLESGSKPGQNQHIRSTADEPVSCTTARSGQWCGNKKKQRHAAAQPPQHPKRSQQRELAGFGRCSGIHAEHRICACKAEQRQPEDFTDQRQALGVASDGLGLSCMGAWTPWEGCVESK
ncbi:hypothetical protein COCOBI_13-4860 [Coccomyxa sp. Obi]|nr:hypothetical protein COCOBI_13-4860 [Coccomyxa sp. Obi]